MPNVIPQRNLDKVNTGSIRSFPASSTLQNADTAAPAGTFNEYIVTSTFGAGASITTLIVPDNSTHGPAFAIPAAPSSPHNVGWRDKNYDYADQATAKSFISGPWTFTYVLVSNNLNPIPTVVTVIAYAIDASLNTREVFRHSSPTFTVDSGNFVDTFTPSDFTLNAGEILQYEFYFTFTTSGLGDSLAFVYGNTSTGFTPPIPAFPNVQGPTITHAAAAPFQGSGGGKGRTTGSKVVSQGSVVRGRGGGHGQSTSLLTKSGVVRGRGGGHSGVLGVRSTTRGITGRGGGHGVVTPTAVTRVGIMRAVGGGCSHETGTSTKSHGGPIGAGGGGSGVIKRTVRSGLLRGIGGGRGQLQTHPARSGAVTGRGGGHGQQSAVVVTTRGVTGRGGGVGEITTFVVRGGIRGSGGGKGVLAASSTHVAHPPNGWGGGHGASTGRVRKGAHGKGGGHGLNTGTGTELLTYRAKVMRLKDPRNVAEANKLDAALKGPLFALEGTQWSGGGKGSIPAGRKDITQGRVRGTGGGKGSVQGAVITPLGVNGRGGGVGRIVGVRHGTSGVVRGRAGGVAVLTFLIRPGLRGFGGGHGALTALSRKGGGRGIGGGTGRIVGEQVTVFVVKLGGGGALKDVFAKRGQGAVTGRGGGHGSFLATTGPHITGVVRGRGGGHALLDGAVVSPRGVRGRGGGHGASTERGAHFSSAKGFGGGHASRVVGPSFTPLAVQAGVGCGDYSVFITGRGGRPVKYEVPFTTLHFDRTLNSSGRGGFTISPQAGDACAEIVNNVLPWRDEVSVYRDNNLVAVGPLVKTTVTRETATIDFQDLSFWMDRRYIVKDLHFSEDLTNAFVGVFKHGRDQDSSMNLNIEARMSGLTGVRNYKEKDFHRCADVLRELARTAMAYTTIGRTLYVGPVEVFGADSELSAPILIHDQGVLSVNLTLDGSSLATDVAVYGGHVGVDGQPRTVALSARVQENTNIYGLLQQVFTELQIKDLPSAQYNARSRIEANLPVPMSMSVVLSPDAAFTFDQLIPGRRTNVRLSERTLAVPVMTTLRLNEVAVNVDSNKQELITVSLVPIGVSEGTITKG